MTTDTKMLIASNLTLAALLRDFMVSQKGGSPVTRTEDLIMENFNEFLNRLNQQYPENRT